MNIEADRNDWQNFKEEIGLTDSLEASAPNYVEIPAEAWSGNFYTAPSLVAGNGTFASRSMRVGSVVGPAWVKGKANRTWLLRESLDHADRKDDVSRRRRMA